MKGFYVTMKDGPRTAWLLGPFAEHESALSAVPAATKLAQEIDPRGCWYAFGTSSIDRDGAISDLPPGKLNDQLAELLTA